MLKELSVISPIEKEAGYFSAKLCHPGKYLSKKAIGIAIVIFACFLRGWGLYASYFPATEELYTDGTGNVGIGTTDPGGTLVVVGAGDTSATYGFNVTDSSGASNLFIRDDGNVGIGATIPLTKLDVSGSTRIKGSATSALTGSIDPTASTTVTGVGTAFDTELVVGDRITITAETRTVTAIASATSLTVDSALTDTANDTTPDKLAAEMIVKDFSDNIDFIVQDNGNVGIGTTSPDEKLHIYGGNLLADKGDLSSGLTRSLTIGGARNSAGNDYAVINFQNYDDTGGGFVDYIGASISSQNEYGDGYGDLRFSVFGQGTLVNAMTIRTGGFVGIGTTTPQSALEVNGNIRFTNIAGAAQINKIFIGSSGSASDRIDIVNAVDASVKASFLDTGRVGIMTIAPAYTLDVNGDIRTRTNYRSSDGTAGYNGTFSFVDNASITRTLTIKDGLIVGAN